MHLQENYETEELYFSLSHYSIHHFSISFKRQLALCLNVVSFEIFFNDRLCIACSKFHFRKDLSYIETSQLNDSVNHLTGFYLILPFTEKICLKMSLIRYIQLNLFYFCLLNLIRRQFYFINYKDSCKSSPSLRNHSHKKQCISYDYDVIYLKQMFEQKRETKIPMKEPTFQ